MMEISKDVTDGVLQEATSEHNSKTTTVTADDDKDVVNFKEKSEENEREGIDEYAEPEKASNAERKKEERFDPQAQPVGPWQLSHPLLCRPNVYGPSLPPLQIII